MPEGVKVVRKRLASGEVVAYHYWRATGARLPAPDDPGFRLALAAAQQAPARTLRGMAAMIADYRRSPEFRGLARKTQLNRELAMVQLEGLGDTAPAEVKRRKLLELRDAKARNRGPGAANSFVSCVVSIFAWAVDREYLEVSPAYRMKLLPGGTLPAWNDREVQLAMALPERLRRAVVLALYTGQRRSDLVAMTWAQYDGQALRLRQKKLDRRGRQAPMLVIPAHPELRRELDAWKPQPAEGPILLSTRGGAWDPNALSHALQAELPGVGVQGRNIHGLRKLAATRLAEAGCSTHEIAAITGHATLAMVALYTASAAQKVLAEAAMARLETAGGNRRKLRAKAGR